MVRLWDCCKIHIFSPFSSHVLSIRVSFLNAHILQLCQILALIILKRKEGKVQYIQRASCFCSEELLSFWNFSSSKQYFAHKSKLFSDLCQHLSQRFFTLGPFNLDSSRDSGFQCPLFVASQNYPLPTQIPLVQKYCLAFLSPCPPETQFKKS